MPDALTPRLVGNLSLRSVGHDTVQALHELADGLREAGTGTITGDAVRDLVVSMDRHELAACLRDRHARAGGDRHTTAMAFRRASAHRAQAVRAALAIAGIPARRMRPSRLQYAPDDLWIEFRGTTYSITIPSYSTSINVYHLYTAQRRRSEQCWRAGVDALPNAFAAALAVAIVRTLHSVHTPRTRPAAADQHVAASADDTVAEWPGAGVASDTGPGQ